MAVIPVIVMYVYIVMLFILGVCCTYIKCTNLRLIVVLFFLGSQMCYCGSCTNWPGTFAAGVIV